MLMAYIRKNVAKYALPYDIEFRAELPKTLVGKVAYRVLEEEELKKLCRDCPGAVNFSGSDIGWVLCSNS